MDRVLFADCNKQLPDSKSLRLVIYRLVKNNEVIYVGQSKNLKSRACSHRGNEADFDYVYFFDVDPFDANNIEAENIVNHNPKFNTNLPKNDSYIAKAAFKKEMLSAINMIIDASPTVFDGGECRSDRFYYDKEFCKSMVKDVLNLHKREIKQ